MTDAHNELYSYSEEELTEELERRKQVSVMPEMIENPNLEDLRRNVKEYVQAIATMHYHPDDGYDHFIFEAAIEAFYGRGFWDWMNKVPRYYAGR